MPDGSATMIGSSTRAAGSRRNGICQPALGWNPKRVEAPIANGAFGGAATRPKRS
jgi:hypothetical protein